VRHYSPTPPPPTTRQWGITAAYSNTTGIGINAFGKEVLYANTTGTNNYAFGGTDSIAVGAALAANSTGIYNSAFGGGTLYSNTTGSYNSAFGVLSLANNTTASYNTAVGYHSLFSNTTASSNTAVGHGAAYSNATGTENTAIGRVAGYSNTAGSYNAFLGHDSGYFTTTSNNTFVGHLAGYYVTTGAKNTILGRYNGNQGGVDIRTGSNYVVLSDGDGNPLAYTYTGATFCLQGAGYPQTGTGITFPATQSASSNANTLDDYEEGTWTPIIKGTSTNPSYTASVASGSYVKIGRMVYTSFIIIVTGVSSQGTGNIYMDSLPFTVNDQAYAPSLTVMYNDTWDVDFRAMYANGISWNMRPIGITQSNATWGGSSALSTGYFSGSGCYLTS
jgi:hypothetical protein